MTKFITIKNFEKFQHYKDRNPPWIKLYNDLLDDYNFARLQDASKLHLILLWLLASRSDNRIPADEKWIAARINATSKVNLQELISNGFISVIEDDSDLLADSQQSACLEREGETETDNRENKRGRAKKISLKELSTDHIKDWLEEKRSQGKYKNHDPGDVLEKFKAYCEAKNPKYSDYVAAYRNAFDWDKCQPKKSEQNNEEFDEERWKKWAEK